MRCCLATVIYHAASQRRPSHWRSSPTPCTPRQRHTDLVLAAVVVDHQLAAERVNAVQFSRRAFVQRPSERAAATRISARSGSNDLVVILDLAVAIGTTTCTAQVPLLLSPPFATCCSILFGFVQALAKHKQTGLFYALSSASRAPSKSGVVGVSSWSSSRPCQGSRLPLRWGPNLSNVAYLAVGHWVLPRRPLCSTQDNSSISQSVECLEWTLDLTSLEHAGTQSITVSLGLNFQYNLHGTGLPLEHAQSQLRSMNLH